MADLMLAEIMRVILPSVSVTFVSLIFLKNITNK